MTALRPATYPAATGPEFLLARGPRDAPQLLLVQPLFEEATFTRSVASDLLRSLAAEGIGGWLFDLPGQGDSLVPLATLRLADWIAATRAAAAQVAVLTGRPPMLAAIRGGALLIDGPAWRLAPCDGAALLRPLRLASALGDSAGLAGWPVSIAMQADLTAAILPPGHAIDWPEAAPPWRRVEPARYPAATAILAADLRAWMLCAAH